MVGEPVGELVIMEMGSSVRRQNHPPYKLIRLAN